MSIYVYNFDTKFDDVYVRKLNPLEEFKMRRTFRKCLKCGSYVEKETCKGLRKEYPFYYPNCCENMYRVETFKVNKK
jgi:hypothetical protein